MVQRFLCFALLFAAAMMAGLMGSRTEAMPVGQTTRVEEGDVRQLVFFAVLEGLYRDGVSNEDVDIILAKDPKTKQYRLNENFVYTCPLCMPALDAFALYRSRPSFNGWKDSRDKFGAGLDAAMEGKLKSTNKTQRLEAIRDLTNRWVQQRLTMMRLTKEERILWQQRIEEGRKSGMDLLKDRLLAPEFKGCAICEGTLGGVEKEK